MQGAENSPCGFWGESLGWFMLIFQANCTNDPFAQTGLALFPTESFLRGWLFSGKYAIWKFFWVKWSIIWKALTQIQCQHERKPYEYISEQMAFLKLFTCLLKQACFWPSSSRLPGMEPDWQLVPPASHLKITTAEAKSRIASLL